MSERIIPVVDRTLPLHEQEAILSGDHNKGMHRTYGTVRESVDISPELVRITLHIAGLAEDEQWTRPNVSIRIHLEDAGERLSRIYTVRRCDVDRETIEVDVVRHGESSPMMRWLGRIAIGDEVGLVGPRPHFRFPETNGRELLVFADATAIPALFSLLEQMPMNARARCWVATSDEVACAEIPEVPGVAIERIDPGTGFAAHFADYTAGAEVVVWGAGERDEMRAVRSHFRNTLGLSKDEVTVYGYWKRGTSNTAIDEARLRAYEDLLRQGGTVTDMDDLALPI